MTNTKEVSEHEVIGMLSEDGSDIVAYCHERHGIGVCPWCDFIRVERIVEDFMRRLDLTKERIESLNMWSLGTSLKDTKYNRKVLHAWWREFHGKVKRIKEWVPLFRVLEVGRRGFLHFHVVVSEYVDHKKILDTWRSITGEASNVHVSGSPPGRDFTPLIRYLVKYLTKEGSAYRWMGPLYGLGARSRSVSNRKGPMYYGGVTYLTMRTRAYGKRRDPQRKVFQE